MTKVSISGLSKAYQPGRPILRSLDLTIESGELFFLLGPSGCGKSTLLRILTGLIAPDSGSIRFNDTDITALPPEQRQATMVFQNYALWPHLTVYENVAFGLRVAGAKPADIRREVAAALDLVRLGDCADRRIPSLSGGQQQRVALARALAVRPAVLLLDEPLSNLDARLRDEMRLEIRRITRERGLTALYVTHDRREALSMADRVAVLSGGVLQQTGSPAEVYEHPVNRFTAAFLGDGNFLPAKVLANDGAQLRLRTPAGELLSAAASPLRPGDRCTALIRPESWRFDPAPEAVNRIGIAIRDGIYLGDHREWQAACGDFPLLVNESAPEPRRPGDRCTVAVAPERGVLLPAEDDPHA